MSDIQLSIIMPALNEEKNIRTAVKNVYDSIMKYRLKSEIIIINDGSRDGTKEAAEEIIERYKDIPIKLINHFQTMGKGYSFWDGLQYAKGDVVTLMPAHGENDPGEILQYFNLMDYVDMVVPFVFNIDIRSRFRRFVSAIYRFIINTAFGLNLNYTNGTVLYRRSVLLTIKLQNFGFLYQAELLIKLIREGYLYCEVPCWLSNREFGSSRSLTWTAFIRITGGLLNLFWQIHIAKVAGRGNKKPIPDSVTAKRVERNTTRGQILVEKGKIKNPR